MQESPIKPGPVWTPPLTVEMRTLQAIERIEKLIAEYIMVQNHPRVVVTAQSAVPKPQGKKR